MQGEKLRVAFFGDDFSRQGKGTALVVRKIAETLVLDHSEEVEVILLRPAGVCRSVICEKVRPVIIPRKFSTFLSYIWFFFAHRDSYDAVVFNRVVYPAFWMLNAKKRILIVHDASKSDVYTVRRTPMNVLFEWMVRLQKHWLDAVVCDSNDAKKWVVRHYRLPETKVKVLYLAAGSEYRTFSETEKKEARKRFAELPYILDVSRFDPHKNIEGALDAFFQLKERGIPHALILVGGAHTPDYSRSISDKIATSQFAKYVRVIDYVSEQDMPALYACADLLVYPSLVEGFGLPILEAMKSGAPVVTSNISSMPEIAGGAALLVNPLDSRLIADGVQRVLDDSGLRGQLIEKGLRRASEFSWKKTAEEFLQMVRVL